MKNNFEAIMAVIGLLVLWVLLLGMPLQWLWNWLMPKLFSLPYITFWEAIGINIMVSILFRPTVNVKKD